MGSVYRFLLRDTEGYAGRFLGLGLRGYIGIQRGI